jgi:hypothetical protein
VNFKGARSVSGNYGVRTSCNSDRRAHLPASSGSEALEGLLTRYVDFVESGDAGFWDAEQELCVIRARAALTTPQPAAAELPRLRHRQAECDNERCPGDAYKS